MTEPLYAKSLRIGDREIHVQGDKAYVEEEFQKLYGLIETKRDEARTAPDDVGNSTKDVSLREFANLNPVKSQRDWLLVVGYYLEKFEGVSSYTRETLIKRAVEHKIPLGRNVHRDIQSLQAKGLLEVIGKEGGLECIRLTLTGERLVQTKEGQQHES